VPTVTQRNLNPRTVGVWLGRLTGHAGTRPALAAHAAWLAVSMLVLSRPADADTLVNLADHLGLVEPRLIHWKTRKLASRSDSTDRSWAELAAYRDALAARQAAIRRRRAARAPRRGHSAPATRPQRRRFTTSAR
jgi:hypothetical protein